MTTEGHWPQIGDPAVDLFTNGRPNGRPSRVGADLTVRQITQTLVITSDGERYNRQTLKPVSEGRYSDRTLVPASDPRVLAVRARDHLAEVARMTANLSSLDHKTADNVVGAMAQIIASADASRRAILDLMRDASKMEQESNR